MVGLYTYFIIKEMAGARGAISAAAVQRPMRVAANCGPSGAALEAHGPGDQRIRRRGRPEGRAEGTHTPKLVRLT